MALPKIMINMAKLTTEEFIGNRKDRCLIYFQRSYKQYKQQRRY